MEQITNKSGYSGILQDEYPIDKTTEIVLGAVVKLSSGKVVLADAGETGDILGISVERHSGKADALNTRSNGNRIIIADSPTAVFTSKAPEITATGGTSTTIISTSGLAAGFANDDFNNGFAKLIEKTSNSTNTDPVGTVYNITDYNASTQTMTIDTAGGAITSGDKFLIFPPLNFSKGNLNTNRLALVLTATADISLKIIGYNLNENTIELYPTNHFLK